MLAQLLHVVLIEAEEVSLQALGPVFELLKFTQLAQGKK